MIQEIITYYCNECESANIEKNGTDYKGSQKYHCLDCNAYGTLHPQSRLNRYGYISVTGHWPS